MGGGGGGGEGYELLSCFQGDSFLVWSCLENACYFGISSELNFSLLFSLSV